MADVPQTVNTGLETADKVTEGAISVLSQVAITAAQFQVPLLKAPVISVMFEAAVKWLFGKIQVPLMRLVDIKVIDAQVGKEAKEYGDAKDALKSSLEKGSADDQAKAYAAFQDKLRALVKYDGS